MSSAVLAMTTRSSPTTSSIPRASFAPPLPPASTTTITDPPSQTRDLDPRVRLVAHVDRDQQRGERLGDAGHLEAAGVDGAQAVDAIDERHHALLVLAAVAAHEHILVERVIEVAARRR